jgi:hypothetical protein
VLLTERRNAGTDKTEYKLTGSLIYETEDPDDASAAFHSIPTETYLRNNIQKSIDVRNFHKKMNSPGYVLQTDETEQGMPHRSARFYRFDKKGYHKIRAKLNAI